MRQNEGYLPEVVVYPTSGLNSMDPSTQIDTHFTPSCLNMTFNKGEVRKRTGYRTMGAALSGTVMEVISFEVGGVVKTVAITTTKEYVWNTGGGTWDSITAVAGDRTGGTDDVIQWVIGTDSSGTWLYITNGKDAVRRWDGVAGHFTLAPCNLGGFTTCKALAIFQNSIIFANLVGTAEPKTLAWSDTANFGEFLAGNADAQLLQDADGEIEAVKILGDRLCVYTRNSLYLVTYVGAPTVYTIVRSVSGTRLLSSKSIVDVGPFHVWAGEENSYLYEGTSQIQPLGDIVQQAYRDDLSLNRVSAALSFYDSMYTQILTVVPRDAGDSVIYVNELQLNDYTQRRWSRWQLFDSPNSLGYFVNDKSYTWTDLTALGIKWSEWSQSWQDNKRKVGFPVLIFGSGSQVYLLDGTVWGDNGNAVEAWIDTIDFTIPAGGGFSSQDYKPVRTVYESQLGRWLEVEIELRGTAVQVLYSVDKGLTYQQITGSDVTGFNQPTGVQTLSTEWKRYRFFFDAVAPSVRIRLYDKSQANWFERRWLKIWVQPQGGY